MDGPVLLDLMSSFHFLSQLHGWLTVCPKGAIFIVRTPCPLLILPTSDKGNVMK